MLVGGNCQSHATTMISTAVSPYLQQPVTPPSVHPAQRADGGSAQDFAALVSRFYAPNLSVAALTQNILPPDTSQAPASDPAPKDDTASSARDTRANARPKRNDQASGVEAQPASTAEQRDQKTSVAPPPTQNAPDDPQSKQPDATAVTTPRQTQQPADSHNAAAAKQGTTHPAPGTTQPTLPAKDAAAAQQQPQPQPQTKLPQDGAAATSLKAQVVDGSPKDPLPSLGHLLSSSTAVAAQSEAGKTHPTADNGAGPKNDPSQQTAASALTAAAQSAAGAAAKAKGPTKVGGTNNGHTNAQAANGTQAGQAAGVAAGQTAQQPAPVTPQQTAFNNLLSAKSGGSNDADTQTPLPGRGDPLNPTAGAESLQQGAPRGTAAAAPAKPPAPVPPRIVANQVAVQIQKAVGDGNDRISIQLKPAELGKVDVRLDVSSDGRVSAVITAHRADTLDLLQRDARILQNALQDAGLQADANSLSFELHGNGAGYGNDGNGSTGSAGRGGGAAIEDATAANPITAQARPGVVSNDRVDIHV